MDLVSLLIFVIILVVALFLIDQGLSRMGIGPEGIKLVRLIVGAIILIIGIYLLVSLVTGGVSRLRLN